MKTRHYKMVVSLVTACLSFVPLYSSEPLTRIQLAITIDDLPWVGAVPAEGSNADAMNRIAATLRVHDAPATGFVVCNRVIGNKVTEQILQNWVAWGLTLGNHTSAHLDLNTTNPDQWLEGVRQCDSYLRKYGSAVSPYLRFPYLHQGNTKSKRNQVSKALANMGLGVAHVSVDNSEWILNRNYARVIQNGKNNKAALRHQLGIEFIRHIEATLQHAHTIAIRKTGRAIPQILLLHANTLVDDKLDELLLALRSKNVEFISLEQALADPAYSLEDGYIGPKGLSWLYRMKPQSVQDATWDEAEALIVEKNSRHVLANGVEHNTLANTGFLKLSHASADNLANVYFQASKSERMRALLIMHKGQLIAEGYFNGAGPETPQNLKSITKSLVSALIGIALRKGWISSLDEPIKNYLDISEKIPAGNITIRELLTMSSGLKAVDYGSIQQSENWVTTLVSQNVDTKQKGVFHYDTGIMQLLTALLTKVGGSPIEELAQRELFTPLDASTNYWRTDSNGIAFGGADAYLLPRHLIKLGELYRLGGLNSNTQLLANNYVSDSITKQILPKNRTINHNTLQTHGYGYLWWLIDLGGEAAYAALGHGGQILLVAPKRALVVLMNSRWPGPSSSEHYHHLRDILVDGILPLFPAETASSEGN